MTAKERHPDQHETGHDPTGQSRPRLEDDRAATLTTRAGTVDFRGHKTWYQITTPSAPITGEPVVILHGGPGMAHNYCQSMSDLALDGRLVVHYDQLGCGRSTHLPDAPAEFWTVDLFVDELKCLTTALGLSDYHVLGQSWGGMFAPEYVLAHPDGIRSMTLADPAASMERWVRSTNGLRAQLPERVQAILDAHERAGTTDHAEYLAAVDEFYQRFLCRIHPYPAELQESFAQMESDPTVYQTMIGPSEFHITGTLLPWSVEDRLDRLDVPTLVVAGEFDEAQPVAWEPFVQRIPGARAHVFAGASHTPHLESRSEFAQVVGAFLRQSELGA